MGEFTCSRQSGYGFSWAVQSFAVPDGVRYLDGISVGVGARDSFTVSLRRGGSEVAAVRAPGGVDEVADVSLGRVGVFPGETLELWVGEADGWTSGGSRAPSRLFNVVRTQGDGYGPGAYRTTNGCPGQAPSGQMFGADMQARVLGWTG